MAILSTTTNYPLATSGTGWTLNGPDGSGLNPGPSANGKWNYWDDETGSNNTGPADPTSVPFPGPDAYYWYTETSGTSLGEIFTMELDDTLDSSTYNYLVDFWYSNYGTGGGGECLIQYWNGSSWDDVQTVGWNTFWNSSIPWLAATQIDLSAYSNADGKIRWHFTTGGGTTFQNDFGLDDITFTVELASSSSSSTSSSSSSSSNSSSSESSSSSSQSSSSSSSAFNRFAEKVIFGENTIADVQDVTKDTYLDEEAPDVTFTGSTELTFKRDSEFVNIVLIKFDLKHLEGMVFDAIDSARLYFKTISTPDGVMIGVYGVNKLWESQHVTWRYATDPNRFWDLEGAHNWRTEAGIGDHRYHGDTKTPTTENTWYYWDVTGAVRDQYNRGEYNGFILRFPIEDGDDVFGSVEFHGSTSDADDRPYLVVNPIPGSSSSSSRSSTSSKSSSISSSSSSSFSSSSSSFSLSTGSSSSSESTICAGELTYLDVDYQGFPGGDDGVWGDGTFIYVTNDSQGLFTYSVDGSGNLTHIDTDKQGFDIYRGVWGDGNFIYCACNTDGLRSYSVDGSGNLTFIDLDKQGTTAYMNVWGDGTYIYIAGDSQGLRTYSVDGAGILTFIDVDYQAAFQGEYRDVWGDGNFIYVACHNQGLRSYSVDSTGGLTYIDVDDQGGDYRGVWGDGNFIYAACSNGLRSYSVDGSGNLTFIDVDYQGSTVYDHVWGDGIYIYVANWSDGLRSYSVDGSGNLTFIDVDVQNDGEFLDVYMRVWGDGTYIYVACNTGGIRSYEVCTGFTAYNYFDNTYWQANTFASWDAGNSEWDPQSPWLHLVDIEPKLGSGWASGFNPSYVRITLNNITGNSGTFQFEYGTDGNGTQVDSGVAVINGETYTMDLTGVGATTKWLRVTNEAGLPNTLSITNIVFYA